MNQFLKPKLWIIIFSIIGFGCQKSNPIEIQSVIGKYQEIPNSEDYNQLELREDFTYYFNQAKYYSCSVWGHWYGEWEIIDDEIVLYEGNNLDSMIEEKSKGNSKTDTLTIFFEKDFLLAFPNLKVQIGNDAKDRKIENGKVVFNKRNYCEEKNIFEYALSEDSLTYQRFPVELNIRTNNFFYIDKYILQKEKIKIGLGNFNKDDFSKKVLIKYELEKELLVSDVNLEWVNNHQLVKKK